MTHTAPRYLRRKELDTGKWNSCLDQASNGLLYAYTYYLDEMAENWDALVWDDYEAIMPLPWKMKWGLKYLYWVPFVQQLGIFSRRLPTASLLQSGIQHALQHFRYGDLFLNFANTGLANTIEKTNLVLSLKSNYDSLAGNYRSDLLKNLHKAAKGTMHYTTAIDLATAAGYYQQTYQQQIGVLHTDQYQQFVRLCEVAQQHGELLLRGVNNNENQWLATALLLKKHGRMYLLQSTTLPAGRKISANHYLLDQLIREFAGTETVLDFEGSDIAGIAHFYRNFGAVDQPYYLYHFNALPWYLKWIKK